MGAIASNGEAKPGTDEFPEVDCSSEGSVNDLASDDGEDRDDGSAQVESFDFLQINVGWRQGNGILHRFIEICDNPGIHSKLLSAFRRALMLPLLDEADTTAACDMFLHVKGIPIKELLLTDGKLDLKHSRLVVTFAREHKEVFLELQKATEDVGLDSFSDDQLSKLLSLFLFCGYSDRQGGLPAFESHSQIVKSPDRFWVSSREDCLVSMWRQLFRTMYEITPTESNHRSFGFHEVIPRVTLDFTSFTDGLMASTVKMKRLICWDFVQRFMYLLVTRTAVDHAEVFLRSSTCTAAQIDGMISRKPMRTWRSAWQKLASLTSKPFAFRRLVKKLFRVKYCVGRAAMIKLREWLAFQMLDVATHDEPARWEYIRRLPNNGKRLA